MSFAGCLHRKLGLSVHLCLLNSGEGERGCSHVKKQIEKARRGRYWFKDRFWFEYRASCISSTECRFVYFHLTHLELEAMYWIIAHIPSAQGLKGSVCMSVPVHFYMCFMCRLCLYIFTFVRLHIQFACVFLRLYVQRTCAGFLMSLFIVQSNDVFSWGIGSEKVILCDAVCCCYFVLHANAALTPTKVLQSMTLRGYSREC